MFSFQWSQCLFTTTRTVARIPLCFNCVWSFIAAYWLQFVLYKYFLAWYKPLVCIWQQWVTYLKKTDCPSSRSHKLSITSRLEVGAHGPLLHVRMLIGFFLYRSCADGHSCYEFMSTVALSRSEDSVSLWSSVNSDFYNLTTALWVVVPEPWNERVWSWCLVSG